MTVTSKLESTDLQRLRDAFEGMKGHQPQSDEELNNWLATDEGRQATIFETAEVYRWGEMHAGGVRDPADDQKFRSDLLHE